MLCLPILCTKISVTSIILLLSHCSFTTNNAVCTVIISLLKWRHRDTEKVMACLMLNTARNVCGVLIWETTKDHMPWSLQLQTIGRWWDLQKICRHLGCWKNILEGDNLFLSVFSAWMTYFSATQFAAIISHFIIGSKAADPAHHGLTSKIVTSGKPVLIVNKLSWVLLIVIKKLIDTRVNIWKRKKTNKERLLNHYAKLMATNFLIFIFISKILVPWVPAILHLQISNQCVNILWI